MCKFKSFILTVAFLASVIMPINLCAQSHNQWAGFKIGYVGENHGPMIGAFYQYSLPSDIRLSAEAALVCRHHDLNAFKADLNVHYPVVLAEDKCSLYPIAGVDYTSWHVHGLHILDLYDVSVTHSRLGANIGAGFELYTKRNIKFNIEWKYTLTSNYSTTVLDLGVAFAF